MEEPKVTFYSGIAKKTKKPYQAIKVKVGDWYTFIFPKSKFELDYLSENLEHEDGTK